jgi:Immunity protein Imm1
MYVTKLITEDLSNPDNHDREVEHPRWEEIESAVRALDGKARTTVMLEAEGHDYMGISGGNGTYLVTGSRLHGGEGFVLNRPDAAEDAGTTVELNIGGQTSAFAARQIVDLAAALVASRTFAEDGTLDPSLVWKHH